MSVSPAIEEISNRPSAFVVVPTDEFLSNRNAAPGSDSDVSLSKTIPFNSKHCALIPAAEKTKSDMKTNVLTG